MQDKFLSHFAKMVSDARPIREPEAILRAHNVDSDVKIQYHDQAHFEQIARKFGIFYEWKVIFFALQFTWLFNT